LAGVEPFSSASQPKERLAGSKPPPAPSNDSATTPGRGRGGGRAPEWSPAVAPTARLQVPDELVGQAAENTAYVGGRLHYEKERELEEFDPIVSGRYWRALFMRALLVFVIWVLGLIPLAIIELIFTVINTRFGLVMGILLDGIWWLAMGFAFWFGKLPARLSEWKFSVDRKGSAAPEVFDHVAWSFTQRDTPTDSIGLRRFRVPGQPGRDLLELRQGIFYALVSCLANGDDLYIGWTLWFYLSPVRVLWIAFLRLLWELRYRRSSLYVSVQFDRAKALREAIHASVREGVDVAADNLAARGQGTIGSIVPITDDSSLASAPWLSHQPQP
jgi:hypothetical protein